MMRAPTLVFALIVSACAHAEDTSSLIERCSLFGSADAMRAIVKVESGGNPLAININGGAKLVHQPKDKAQAIFWSEQLIKQGYSIDMGIAQVNSKTMQRIGLKPAALFDTCSNLKAASTILYQNYQAAGANGHQALFKAISAYNTGNHRAGFTNGYVAKVARAAGVVPPSSPVRRVVYKQEEPGEQAPLVVYAANP